LVTSAAGKTERADAPPSSSGDETPSESLARGSDGDASPINNEGTLKSWAKGTRSHTRYGSVSGAPGTNGRSVKTLPRAKELVEALMAAARIENENEVTCQSFHFSNANA
jgi:hypothetical protein